MRNDKDIIDINEQAKIIDECEVCRVGFYDKGNSETYIVPMNFGYEYNDKLIFYFHGSPSGRKYDLIKESPSVGFELDCGYELKKGNNACSYSAKYKSIIGNGKITIIDNEREKIKALNLIMKHYTNNDNWDFNPKYFSYVAVYKLEVQKVSVREHL